MNGQKFILKFDGDKAYLTVEKFLTFKQLNLPDVAERFNDPASWVFRVLNYIPAEKKIFAEIISYERGNITFPDHQLLQADELSNVEKISFRSIDTNGLLRTLAGNRAPTAIPLRYDISSPSLFLRRREPRVQTIKEKFSIPLKNTHFKNGCVSFSKKIKQLNKTVEFSITNDNIREEFDAVKNYFANVLRTKKIQVEIEIQITNEEITNIEAISQEIAQIDKNLIDIVKFEFVSALSKKNAPSEIEKSLFTMDEFFETLAGKEIRSNTFYNNDKDLLEDLLQITNTKHYKHLLFLSSKHAHSIVKLRFVLKPFSFVFLINGENNYHIIWETLNTEEATYIWHVDKDLQKLKLTFKKIEDIINVIKVEGKTPYLNTSDDSYRRIFHDYSELVDGFVKWKGELESVLS